MARDRLHLISELYHAASGRPADQRAAFLAEACGQDDALRKEVESLLAQDSKKEFLEQPAAVIAAQLVSDTGIPLQAGRRIGVYEIQSLLGAGGMGEVYRAHDTRLGRDVAVKILPTRFTSTPDRLARFEREARMLAALNHPHVAAIYGIEDSEGIRALIMELVEGETLAKRLQRNPSGVRINEALTIGLQISAALESAHEKGIVHRDLKLSNIAMTPEGAVKVLDFGLAKLATADRVDGKQAEAPTTEVDQTAQGVIVGTAAYMSPEQTRGERVDKRTDIWAFGCVLYEMLAGRAAFRGGTVSDTFVAIREHEPDWSALPDGVTLQIRRMLRRCLEKDPRRRLHDIADARLEIEEAESAAPGASSVTQHRAWWPWAVASTGLLAIVAALVLSSRLMLPSLISDWGRNGIRFTVEPSAGTSIVAFHFAISPDGRQLAWAGSGSDGVRRLWIRPLASELARELQGTEGASYPFWSPDSRAVGFLVAGGVKRADLASGSVQTLATTSAAAQGATWGSDDIIVFSARFGLYAVPATGGEVRLVAEVDRTRGEDSLRFPQFLPDGRRFLYVARSGQREKSSAYIGTLDEPPKRLFPVVSKVEYASGHLVFQEDGRLIVRPFDPQTLTVGEARRVTDDLIGPNQTGLAGYFTVSNGVMAYRHFKNSDSVLGWFDRSGKFLETLGTPKQYARFRIAPDGRRVATSFPEEGTTSRSVWILEGETGPQRLTAAGIDEWEPIWSSDGSRIAFGSNRNGPQDIYEKSATDLGGEKPLLLAKELARPESWSSKGFLAYVLNRASTRLDLFVLPPPTAPGNREPITIAESEANEHWGRFSPDGRWIAYVSDETGRPEVFVQPFPPTGSRWQITVNGADQPEWSGDGRELYYIGLDGTLIAVTVITDTETFRVASAKQLFRTVAPTNCCDNRYDVTPDGQRFLILTPADPSPPEPLIVVVNWVEQLKQRESGTSASAP